MRHVPGDQSARAWKSRLIRERRQVLLGDLLQIVDVVEINIFHLRRNDAQCRAERQYR